MALILVTSLLWAPLVGFFGLRRLVPDSVMAQLVGTVMGGSAAGAFLASAASAMATAVDPNDAMRRGAMIGAGTGIAIGALCLGVTWAWRRVQLRQNVRF